MKERIPSTTGLGSTKTMGVSVQALPANSPA
jgi:hypothetical protein